MKKKILFIFLTISLNLLSESTLDRESFIMGKVNIFKNNNRENYDYKNNFGYEIMLERYVELYPYLDFGLGVGYQNYGKIYKNINNEKINYKSNSLETVAFYGIGKSDLFRFKEGNIYLKGDFGISFSLSGDIQENFLVENRTNVYKIENGFYSAGGIGATYKNILLELMYKVNTLDYDNNTLKIKRISFGFGYIF